ncbi:MAG TPA: type I methionyl aminopeptidase [Firmicutes bacterium]|nr:type I methionyl aminopeptidase [Bacillota bacterium]
MIVRKSDEEIRAMRQAGRVVAQALERIREAVRPGVTTLEIDAIAEDCIRRLGGIPSFKGFHGFPKSVCASVNEEVVHGIPGKRRLKEGDIVSIDVGAIVNGFHGDAAITLPVGEISDEARRLLRVTEEALYKGIDAARAGRRVMDISHAIQSHVESHGFSVVRSFVGHGIGRNMHEDPQVPNFVVQGSSSPLLKPGMVLAIEPMVNAGDHEVVVKEDKWTVVTKDSSLSAHFEHTVAITSGEPEILTRL